MVIYFLILILIDIKPRLLTLARSVKCLTTVDLKIEIFVLIYSGYQWSIVLLLLFVILAVIPLYYFTSVICVAVIFYVISYYLIVIYGGNIANALKLSKHKCTAVYNFTD